MLSGIFRVQNLNILAALVSGFGIILFAVSTFSSYPYLQQAAVSCFTAGGLLSVYVRISQARKQQEEEIKSKRQEVQDIEAAPIKDGKLEDFLHRHVKLAVAREQVSMLLANRRANQLYSLGVTLLTVSVVCPILAATVYWWLDPLPQTTITRIGELKKAAGDLPKDLGMAVARDWHILLGGVAFGFLCLAAARGLLAQRARETKTYFDLGEKVNYYERLSSVIDIKTRAGLETKEAENDLIDFIITGLRGDPTTAGRNASEDGESADMDGSPLLKAINDLLKTRST